MNPAKLKRSIAALKPITFWIFFVSAPISLIYALYISPPDYLHGELVRILYVHVPAAWLAVGIYAVMGVFSFAGLVIRIIYNNSNSVNFSSLISSSSSSSSTKKTSLNTS